MQPIDCKAFFRACLVKAASAPLCAWATVAKSVLFGNTKITHA